MQYQTIVAFHNDDIPAKVVDNALSKRVVAWDIETSGLDWRNDHIALCQIFIPGDAVHVVRTRNGPHPQMERLLSDASVQKIFHHAMFDLGFMGYHWGVIPRNIACTKIASKVLDPERSSHSLKHLTEDYLGVTLDKSVQQSDWFAENLSKQQIDYAVADVIYLPQLYDLLRVRLIETNRFPLAKACFEFLSTRLQLSVLGAGDVFTY